MRQEIFITEELAGDRIDKFLSEQCEELSRSFIQKLLKSGEVFVGQKPVKASYKVSEGDVITFEVNLVIKCPRLAQLNTDHLLHIAMILALVGFLNASAYNVSHFFMAIIRAIWIKSHNSSLDVQPIFKYL